MLSADDDCIMHKENIYTFGQMTGTVDSCTMRAFIIVANISSLSTWDQRGEHVKEFPLFPNTRSLAFVANAKECMCVYRKYTFEGEPNGEGNIELP